MQWEARFGAAVAYSRSERAASASGLAEALHTPERSVPAGALGWALALIQVVAAIFAPVAREKLVDLDRACTPAPLCLVNSLRF